MTTFANALARRDGQWCYLVRIEGFGTDLGPFTWCDTIPDYAAADPLYSRGLAAWPDPLSERSEALGGSPEAGSITVELVDLPGLRPAYGEGPDLITAAMALDRSPRTRLAADLTATETGSLTITGSGLSSLELPTADDVVWIGSEAIRYDTRSGATVSGLTRGFLGTDALSHKAGDSVWTRTPPYIRARKLFVYMVPLDADDAGEEELLDEYRIDGCVLVSDGGGVGFNRWRITAASRLGHLGRQIAGYLPAPLRVDQLGDGGGSISWVPATELGIGSGLPFLRGWSDSRAYVQIESEILRVRIATNLAIELIEARAEGGTKQVEIAQGMIIRQVLLSDPVYGSFRFSPGSSPSENRSTGTWTVSAHFVDIMLCLLLSSAHPDDGLELQNHAGVGGLYADASLSAQARSNWSSLPVGFGAGIPANRVDLESFIEVKKRTAGFLFPNVAIREPQTLARFFVDNFLRPIGAFLATSGNKLKLILPRLPIASETTLETWDDGELLEVGDPELEMSKLAGGIVYIIPGPRGEETRTTFRASDIGIQDQRGYYALDDKPTEIPVPGARTDQAGLNAFLIRIAERRLLRFARPHWKIRCTVDFSHFTVPVGGLVAFTHADLANLETGVRGVTGMICQVVERKVRIDEDRGPVIEVLLVGYAPQQRGGRIAPSGSIFFADTTGGNDRLQLAVNRYTSPDNALLGLPATDAEAFRAGDIVIEMTRAGVQIGTPRAVVSIDGPGSRIVLSGLQSPAPAIGNVITFADYSDEVEAQTSEFVSLADDGTLEIITGVPAWAYAET